MENKYEKVTFKDILLGHIKRILELSSHQLRDTTTSIIHQNYVQETSQEDTRYSYIQAVESLAFLYRPKIKDDKIIKEYDKYTEIINFMDYEVIEKMKERYTKIKEGSNKQNIDAEFVILMKRDAAKKLFCLLAIELEKGKWLQGSPEGDPVGDSKDEKKEQDEVIENG